MSIKRLAGILFIAAILAVFIRMVVFETIRIATPAMSESQPSGNRLIVEKWSLGARIPLSIGLPLTSDSLMGKPAFFQLAKKAHRLPGFREIHRNDLIAFNFPVKDNKPLDMHPILLSRCIGLPGDYVRLKGIRLFVNDEEIKRPEKASICYGYPVAWQSRMIRQLKSCHIDQETYQEKDSGFVYLTRHEYDLLTRRQSGDNMQLKPCTSSFDEKTALVPYEGFRIKLTDRSFGTWSETINKFEGVKLTRIGKDHFRKNGKDAEFYIFKQNYYWVLNDHQGYLNDSRGLGLIPESHVIGRAWLVLFSPATKRFLQKI